MIQKINRDISHLDLTYFCEDLASRGSYVESFTKDEFRIVRPGQNGGTPLGVLLNNVVNLDFTRHINWYNNEIQSGGKVEIFTRGILTIRCKGNPTPDMFAYYDKDGIITAEHESRQVIGRFLSHKDEDGFATIEIKKIFPS